MSFKYFYCAISRPFQRRASTINERTLPTLYIPAGSNIFAFGTPSQTKTPLLRNFGWSIEQGEAWAVVSGSGGGKGAVFKTLLGHTRVVPPSLEIQADWAKNGGLYPFLATTSEDPYARISHVSFRQRSGADSGAFIDYTTRYGAVREGADRITLRDTLCPSSEGFTTESLLLKKLVEDMDLSSLMDLPIITLSNGQTRRVRIMKAILSQPELLLLNEPLTGLDASSCKTLNNVLQDLYRRSSPQIILGLRKGEEIPTWVTHVLELRDGTAFSRKNDTLLPQRIVNWRTNPHLSCAPVRDKGKPIVDLKNVNVSYGDRSILKNINWKIRQGERWQLRGANGSGKTTLLALLTGDHPQSYVQDHLLLPSFSFPSTPDQNVTLLPRSRVPTAHLRRLIGSISPEIFDAFPRRHPGMSVWEAVTTGFDGGFVPRTREVSPSARKIGGLEWVDVSDEEIDSPVSSMRLSKDFGKDGRKEKVRRWRIYRCWEVLRCLGPASWVQANSLSHMMELTKAFATVPFASLSPGEQRLVLLMRALVIRPPLILLDEAWSGMDDNMIAAVRRYLRGEVVTTDGGHVRLLQGIDDTQAVVVISHREEDIPWKDDEVRFFDL